MTLIHTQGRGPLPWTLSTYPLCQIYTLLYAKAGLHFILTANRSPQPALFRAVIVIGKIFVSYPFSSHGFYIAGPWTLPQTTQPSSLTFAALKMRLS